MTKCPTCGQQIEDHDDGPRPVDPRAQEIGRHLIELVQEAAEQVFGNHDDDTPLPADPRRKADGRFMRRGGL